MEPILELHTTDYHIVVASLLPAGGKRDAERATVAAILNYILPESHGQYAHRPDGAPHLPDFPHLHLSITHSRDVAAVAISSRPIGIDIELIQPRVSSIAPRVMSYSELTILRQSTDIEVAFTTAWTAKEALFKIIPEQAIDFRSHIIADFPSDISYRPNTVITYNATEMRTEAHLRYALQSRRLHDYIFTVAIPR